MRVRQSIFFLGITIGAIGSCFLLTNAAVSPSSIKDIGTIEAKILTIFKKPGFASEFVTLKILAIRQYRHHAEADFPQLKVGDEITAYLYWGVEPRKVQTPSAGASPRYLELPGVGVGDTIEVFIFGCPETAQCGTGWRLYRYSLVSRALQPELPKEEPVQEPPPTPPPSFPIPPKASEQQPSEAELQRIKTESEIIALLLHRRIVDKVLHIEFDETKEIYNAKGSYRARFISLFPCRVPVGVRVGAGEGNVFEVIKPWWWVLMWRS